MEKFRVFVLLQSLLKSIKTYENYVQSLIILQELRQFEVVECCEQSRVYDQIMICFQKQLGLAVKMYERRIEWLGSGSRKIWGTITEKRLLYHLSRVFRVITILIYRIIFLIDTSISNKPYVIHIQHSLRLLLEQQTANKQAFNIIA